jgi:kynurenine formamidase
MPRTTPIIAIGLAGALGLAAASSAAQEAWYASKYGEDDTIGAANNLSPEGVRNAASLIRTGKVYALGVPTGPETPAYGSRTYEVSITPAPGGDTTPNGTQRVTSHDERIVTSMGIGSQLDGLGHLGVDHHYYNGLTGAEVNTAEGFRKLDTASVPPIVTRGILLDMTKVFGKPVLEVGDEIGRAQIEAAAAAAGVTIGAGDVVLLHTGWMGAMAEANRDLFRTQEPGLNEEGAIYLADLGVVAVGADNIALEALPSPPGKSFIVHQTLLAKHGVYILEAMNTGALAADGVTEFMFVLGQPRFVGTVQVVINPIAIT